MRILRYRGNSYASPEPINAAPVLAHAPTAG